MKVLLKETATGRFLSGSDRWTPDPTDALNFRTTPAAMDYSRIHGYSGSTIILKFINSQYDLELKNCC